jgi:hypothetical protein
MSELKRDVLIGVLFVSGMLGFMTGEFIVSTVFFAAAAVFSNLPRKAGKSVTDLTLNS